MQQDLFALFISSTYPVNWWLQIMFAVFHIICPCQKYLTITWLQQGFFFELGYVSRGDCQRMSKAFFVATQSLCLHVSLAQSTHELTSCWWVDSLLVDSSINEGGFSPLQHQGYICFLFLLPELWYYVENARQDI